MEIEKGQVLSKKLADKLLNETTPKDREMLAKEHGIHVNSINNKINDKKHPVTNVEVIEDLCRIAFRNADIIIKDAKSLKKFLNKFID